MARVRRFRVPLLAGLLVAALLGPGAVAGAEPRAMVTTSIVIPASAFVPSDDALDYSKSPASLGVLGAGHFAAPVVFPVPVVAIRKVTLYASDTQVDYRVCAQVIRVRPVDYVAEGMTGSACTQGSGGHQAPYTTTVMTPRVNTAVQGPLVWVTFDGPGLSFYGVKVNYAYDPGA